MNSQLLQKYINGKKRTDMAVFRRGHHSVHVKIKEGDKERLQAFEGTLIARHNSGWGNHHGSQVSLDTEWNVFSP